MSADPKEAPKPPKIIFINRYFYPDIAATGQILADLAFHLPSQFQVHVVTSRQRYDDRRAALAAFEHVQGIDVHRIWTTSFGRSWLPGRALDYATFYISAAAKLASLCRKSDVIVAMTDPPLLSIPSGRIARIKGAHLVNWLQDLFPEVGTKLGVRLFNGPVGDSLLRLRNGSLQRAASNVVLGERMAARLLAEGIDSARIQVIHNWADGVEIAPLDPAANPLRAAWGLQGKFVVGYSGNMGRAHDLAALLDAAGRLSHRDDIVFLLIGHGSQRAALEARVATQHLKNVMFKPYQPRNALKHSLTAPDCHIVSLKPALEGLIVPSKLYSSLASARPIIFLGAQDGEIGTLLATHARFGLRCDADGAELARAVEHLATHPSEAAELGRTGRLLFESRFDRMHGLASWRALLSRLTSQEQSISP